MAQKTKTFQEQRNDHMQAQMNALLRGLCDAGFEPVKTHRWNDSSGPVEHWNDAVTVKYVNPEDGVARTLAVIEMNTGRGWHSRFDGWKVRLPTYEPRGSHNRDSHRRDPSDPWHWGFANIKSTNTVLNKIEAAITSIPTDNDVRIGELRVKLDSLRYDDRSVNSDRRAMLSDREHQIEILELLKDAKTSDRLRRKLDSLQRLIDRETEIKSKRDKLWEEIDALEQEGAA